VTPERWQQIKAVLDGALEREGAERAVFLAQACGDDDELRREVESFAASETEIGDFIETPVFRIRLEEVEPLAVGQRVGAYRIVREIGRGGMGAVYLAERADQEFKQSVAIKVVRRGMDTEEIVRRFRSERQILAHLDHPNIAKLFDGGTTEDGRPYFVMEHVEGRPIDEFCDDRKLPVRARLELFRQVCGAVHFAHQNLIVHRDLKPGNILVTADGVPKLLDFGIAKLLDPNQDLFALTRVDLRPMTPEYASPEQVRGETITTASDVYSLGVLLYVLLTGHRPYRSEPRDPQGLAKEICETNPPRPSSVIGPADVAQRPEGEVRLLRRRLAGDLDTIVLKAMQKEPQRRYASVDQLAGDLGRHLQGLPVVARKDTLGYRTRKFVGRHKLGVAAAAALLLLIVAFAVTATVLWRRAVREEHRARAVSSFLVDLLAVSNPSESRGRPIQAREVLDHGLKMIRQGSGIEPELRADILETLGRVYRSLGLYTRAGELLTEALRLDRETQEPDSPLIVQDLHNLAGALYDSGKSKEAEPLIREALRIQEARQETQNIDYAKGLSNLGEALLSRGELDSAEALLKKSLDIKLSLPQPHPKDVAFSLNAFGKLYATRGQYALAGSSYQKALQIRRTLAGGLPDPEVATTLANLASLQENLGNLAGADAAYREVLEMRRKLFGDRNQKVAFALNNLGYVLSGEGKAVEAETCFREALSILGESSGRKSKLWPSLQRNLAVALLRQGKAAEAETNAREALAIFRAEQPPTWRAADAESVLGACLTAEGRYQEAEPLLLESYPILLKDKGDGAKHAAEARQRISDLYKAWGKPEKVAMAESPHAPL
jgi:serine/threonine protein kinase/tetratricopeptide (TPR) repeat protein